MFTMASKKHIDNLERQINVSVEQLVGSADCNSAVLTDPGGSSPSTHTGEQKFHKNWSCSIKVEYLPVTQKTRERYPPGPQQASLVLMVAQ